MKMPKFPKLLALKSRRKLHASTAARRAQPVADEYDRDEPQTRLSSAFIVVLVLHVVAVGGIYAFNSIKAHRKSQEALTAAPLITKTTPPPAPEPAERETRSAPSISPSSPSVTGTLPTTPLPVPGARTHRVAAGENLTKIAGQNGVTVAELEEANGGKKNVATLRIGQLLTIPKASPAAKSPPTTYVVASGDNPMAIARKLHVSYAELLKVNNIDDPKKLQPGQKLKLPPAKKN